MKKNLYFILAIIICLLLVTSCASGSETNTNTKNETGAATETEGTIKDKEQDEEGSEQDLETEASNKEETNDAVDANIEEQVQEPLYEMTDSYSIVPITDAPENVVLLTIDDAPDKYALDMAKTLKKLDVSAIFFVNGHFLDTDEKKAMLKEIHELGFPIGNHTMNHKNLQKLSEEEQHYQIVELNNLVESIIGERPKFFRAPFGANTDYSRAVANEERMLVMNWSYGYDFNKEYMNKEAIADIMVNTDLLRNGANLLMHDREWTKDALAEIVKGLQEKGYEMVDPTTIKTVD